MAKTHQTVQKSTGDKCPRKTLALAAARLTEVHASQERFVGSTKGCRITEGYEGRIYHFEAGNQYYSVSARDSESYFGALINNWCNRLLIKILYSTRPCVGVY